MATETEQLVVELEARIAAFEKSFQKANKTASDNWYAIENRGSRAAKRIEADMGRATEGIASGFKSLSGALTANLGLSGALGASGLLALSVRINSELAKMASLAKAADLSTDRLQEVKFAANVGGVSNESFEATLHTSLQLLDEAQRQVNSLQRLFNANGLKIRDQNGELLKFDALLERAADLMARAKSEQAKVQIAEMLGLSRDWVRVLDGGAANFRKLADEARASGVIVDEATIQRAKQFDREWTAVTARFKAGFVSAFADISVAFADFWRDLISTVPGGEWVRNVVRAWGRDLRGMSMPELEAAFKDAVENGIGGGAEAERIMDEIDRRLGIKPVKVRVTAQIEGPDTIIPRDVQKNPFERAVFETNKRIASTDAETRTIGLNTEARERARAVVELEEAAKRANIEAGYQSATITDLQREKINQLADATEAAVRRQRQAQEQFQLIQTAAREFSSSVTTAFSDLVLEGKRFDDVLKNMLKRLADRAFQMAIEGMLFGNGSGTLVAGAGILGSLFGGAREAGGPVDPGKTYLVGEKRPELFVPKTPGTIIPRVPIGGGAVAQSNVFNVSVTGSAGTPEQNADLANQMGKRLEQVARQMVTRELRTQMRPGGLLGR